MLQANRLSDHQNSALRDIHEWPRDPGGPQVFRLFGAAGTGKTTLIQNLYLESPGAMVATLMGKAAHVLRRKGVPAQTIHSQCYVPAALDQLAIDAVKEESRDIKDRLRAMPAGTKRKSEERQLRHLKKRLHELRQVRFILNQQSAFREAKFIILDEVSMVDTDVGKDVLSFGRKVLVVGDPNQLPPVTDDAGFFTNAAPDFELTEVHRQARESGVIRMATDIRLGEDYHKDYGPDARLLSWNVIKRHRNERRALRWADQVICGFHNTRRPLNRRMLYYRGLGSERYPSGQDEALINLKNVRTLGIFNGMPLTVVKGDAMPINHVDDVSFTAFVRPADEPNFKPVEMEIYKGHFDDAVNFEEDRQDDDFDARKRLVEMDWGFVITCHKSQGSEWDKVLVIDDGFAKRGMYRDPDIRRRWLYTAVTRASRRVTIAEM